jgi:hypothetical protein
MFARALEKTKGWKNHPQINRFKAHRDPVAAISFYLQEVHREATKRGYNYNYSKILNSVEEIELLDLTSGQLRYELTLLSERLEHGDPRACATVEGDVEPWETGYWNVQTARTQSN